MTDDILEITWYTGHMDLYLPNLFPCSKHRFKQLLCRVVQVADERKKVLKKLRAYIKEASYMEKDEKRKCTYNDFIIILDKYDRKWRW